MNAPGGGEDPSFMDTGLDFSREEFEPAEKAAMLRWYSDVHEYGGLNLAPFARFWIEHDPGGFKRLKRHLLTLGEAHDGVALPVVAGVLMYAHTYTAIGNGKGSLYEIIAARALGATRAQILELVRHASLFGGPVGMNPLSEISGSYFDEWTSDPREAIAWPDGWRPDPAAFRSGIDHSNNTLTDEESELVRAWHIRMHGEVPRHVDMLIRLHPAAYKTLRIREETTVSGDLPAQMIPLFLIHLSIVRGWPGAMRRAVQMGAALGLRRHHLVCTLYWASVAGGELVLEQAFDVVGDLLEDMA